MIDLYIATSLDGFIADVYGSVQFLDNIKVNQTLAKASYNEFYQSIDTVVLGYTTYLQIMTELSPNQFPYADKNTFVFTRKKGLSNPNVTFTDMSINDFVLNHLNHHIWLVGGASLVASFIEAKAINRLILTLAPVYLGKGIPLFKDAIDGLKLDKIDDLEGMVTLHYHIE